MVPISSSAGEQVSRAWPVMGTYAEVVVWAAAAEEGERAIEAVREAFERVDRTMSVYRPASDISRANALGSVEPVRVDRWVIDLVRKSKQAHAVTAGAFSINILRPEIALGIKPAFSPTDQVRGKLPPSVISGGDDRIRVSGLAGTLFLSDAGMGLDLGGIAKGYALDRAAQAVRARGITQFFLSLGRNVLAGAPPPGEAGWPVRLEHEDTPRLITNLSISVSRQGLMSDTGHILDPKTGRPVSAMRIASVAARRAWVADMASTALMVDPSLGPRLKTAYPDILWVTMGVDAPPVGRTE